jgi:hypothetical protein
MEGRTRRCPIIECRQLRDRRIKIVIIMTSVPLRKCICSLG